MLPHFLAPELGSWLLFPARIAIVFVSASSHWWAVASWCVLYSHLLFFRPWNKGSKENDIACLLRALVTCHTAGTKQRMWQKNLKSSFKEEWVISSSGLSRFGPSVPQQQELKGASQGSCHQDTDSDGPWCSLSLFILPRTSGHKMLHSACRVGLSTSIYPAQKLHHRHPRRFVFMVIINPIE